ncbi:tetratricopeptide repeat protein [bacterium]|nr:tetratricopeptide repeat protein [bacterium]
MAKAATPSAADPTTATAVRRGRPLWQLASLAIAVVSLAGGLAWYLLSPPDVLPADRQAEALERLTEGRYLAAREIAESLQEEGFEDTEFAGGIDYILGMCYFQEGTEKPRLEAKAQYAAATVHLLEAHQRGIPADKVGEWTYALGEAYFGLGDYGKSLPLLEAATVSDNVHRDAATIDLCHIYLDPDWRTTERLESGLRLNAQITPSDVVPEAWVLTQRIELLLALERFTEARETIAQLAKIPDTAAAQTVLNARVLIGEHRYVEACKALNSIAHEMALDAYYPRQAAFLLAWAAHKHFDELPSEPADSVESGVTHLERVEYRQQAIEFYRKVIEQYEGSDEALASLVLLGHLQQTEGAHEKALQSFGTALRSIKSIEDYHNRWMSLDEYRQRILLAWNQWIQDGHYTEARALSRWMTPTFPRDQAYELAARVQQRHAEQLELELSTATTTEKLRREPELEQLWRDVAAAFAQLADARRTALNYPEAVWQAAEHYYRGHDFESALVQVDLFLQTASEAMRPVAMVRRGQILLDLDRPQAAAKEFEAVRKKYPTSPAAFTAAYQLAVCYLEQNQADLAENAWREILASKVLTPAAIEWRDSLFSLATLYSERAAWHRRQIESQTLSEQELEVLWLDVSRQARQAIELWEQYRARYPRSEQWPEADYHLAKCLQLQGDVWQRQFLLAETENTRTQAQREMQTVLRRALESLLLIQSELEPAAKLDHLPVLQQRIFENAWFEIPHTLFALEQYQEAVTAYSAAIHRFPQDIRILTAFIQMAEAYMQLDRPIDARSMIEQAKVLLDQSQIPPTAFSTSTTTLDRAEWDQWLQRARQIQQ